MLKKKFAGVLGSALLMMSFNCHAANWVKNEVDIPNKNVAANFYDADSVRAHAKTIHWTEKFVMTDFGTAAYTKHLLSFPVCKKNITAKGDVKYHQIDLEIKGGKYRAVAKRNYNKNNEVLCTDKDMNNELDKSWRDIQNKSPMYEKYYMLVTKFKLGDI